MVDGKKVYIAKSPRVHAVTNAAGGIRTNPDAVSVNKTKVSLKKGKSTKIKARVSALKKGRAMLSSRHGKKMRYKSSNPSVATVNAKGKITAKGYGKCMVYAFAINGVRKAVKVSVK